MFEGNITRLVIYRRYKDAADIVLKDYLGGEYHSTETAKKDRRARDIAATLKDRHARLLDMQRDPIGPDTTAAETADQAIYETREALGLYRPDEELPLGGSIKER